MPMCDAFIPTGALEPDAERALVERVSKLLVEHELRRIVDLIDDPAAVQASVEKARSIAWTFVHRTETYVAGVPAELPYYKFVVSIPQGQVDDVFMNAVNREIMQAVVDAEAGRRPHPERRVWVFVHEILDGTWGSGGRRLHLEAIIDFVAPGMGKLAEARWAQKRELLEAPTA